MIILTLDTKKCMSMLLIHHTFDSFSFIEGEIVTFNKFAINGFIQKDFYEEAPEKEYSDWRDLREFCFSIIKGKRTPLNFKFIFSLPKDKIAPFLSETNLQYDIQNIQGLYLNFRYDGMALSCVTGTSTHTFTMDKSLEQMWDKWVQGFFDKNGIAFEAGN